MLNSLLIRIFSSSGSLTEADQLFSKSSRTGVLSVCAVIHAYTKSGQANNALDIFFKACQCSMDQDGHTVAATLQACSLLAALPEGKTIHGYIFERGLDSDVFVMNCIVAFYAQCGCLDDAYRVLERYSRLELVTWSILIGQYTKFGRASEALDMFSQMLMQGIKPDRVIFTVVLNACANARNVEQGMLVHGLLIQSGLKTDNPIENSLIDMYMKCGSLEDARKLFLSFSHLDVVAWSAFINGFTQNGRAEEALQLFWKMLDFLQPNHFTFACALKACSCLKDLCQGMLIHMTLVISAHDLDDYVQSTLMNMYLKCQSSENAENIFEKLSKPHLVDWSTMICGSTISKGNIEFIHLNQVMQEEGVSFDRISFTGMLKACSTMLMVVEARLIHSQILESSCEGDRFIGSSLIDTYSKCRSMEDAQCVFDHVSDKDVVIWGIIMTGYLDHGLNQKVLSLWHQLVANSVEFNNVVIVPALKACCNLTALGEGKLIHICALESGFDLDMYIGSSLINMYSKFGSLPDACRVFECLPKKNVVIWTAMIAGCADQSEYKIALKYFQGMQNAGLEPDIQTFMCLLTACSHVGSTDDYHAHMNFMEDKHGIVPTIDHFNCIADMLGRAGLVQEAKDLLETKTAADNMVGWMSLLNSCQTHGNLKDGNTCLEHIMALDRKHAAGYMLMSKAYATAGMWGNVDTLLALKNSANAWKKPGEAFIELDDKVHSFTVGMRTCPQMHEIHDKLQRLHVQMQAVGYVV
ncbi:hypothetical protein KP509_10G014900 [Ceratopteris richardii]|nr:hypothetical protein KP509_10G014900 [Ceratopteris richardii]